MESNTQIRQRLKAERAALKTAEVEQLSAQIALQLQALDAFQAAQHVGFYHAVRGEADPSLLQAAFPEKQFYLPVLAPEPNEGLVFIALRPETQFTQNQFAIPEPVYAEVLAVNGADLDVVITPLLAFDKHANRLGMGGGYYDRTFAFKQQQTRNVLDKNALDKPALIGFAYDFQEVAHLSPQSWDVALDYAVTETQCLNFT